MPQLFTTLLNLLIFYFIIINLTLKMFQSSQIQQPSSGKKIHGLASRREPSFSLNWDQPHQLNSYQKRKGLDQQVTGKITNIRGPVRSEQINEQAIQRQNLMQLYEKLSYENPHIPPQELQRYIQGYQQKRKNGNQIHTPQQQQHQYQSIQRRAPIKQKQSMRDIIYNNVGIQTSQEQRAASRVHNQINQRNNSNLVLDNGYNHYHNNR